MGLFDGLFGGGREQPESEQLGQVRAEPFVAMLGAKLLDGCEALPGAVGRFGYDADNPIPVNGVVGEITYLNTLRGRSGAGVLFHRLSSTKCSVSPHPVDVYEVVTVDGSQWATLYFSMYHPRRSLRAPADFTRVPWKKIPKEMRAMIHIPAMGSHSLVEDFPMGLPAAVRSSPMLRAVSPGLGDAMARGVERVLANAGGKWVRPPRGEGRSTMPPATTPGASEGTPRFDVKDVGQFVEAIDSLAAGLRPMLLERAGGRVLKLPDMMVAFLEESCLSYSFGIAAFVAVVHNNSWEKTPACKEARAVVENFLEQISRRQFPPELPAVPPERLREAIKEKVDAMLKGATSCSFMFWKPYYDHVHGLVKGQAPGPLGSNALLEWLQRPSSRRDNPLGLLEAELGKMVGLSFGGPEWMSTLEKEFGGVTRDMIRAALKALVPKQAAKAVLVAETGLPFEAGRAVTGTASGMEEPGSPAGFVGMMDVDGFDVINDKLGRGAGDQVMAVYKRLCVTKADAEDVFTELGFETLIREHGGGGPDEFVVCFPYASGDEFAIHHRKLERVRDLLADIQKTADSLDIPIMDPSGRRIAVLHGIPISTGCGGNRSEAWRQVIDGRSARARRSMADRLEVLQGAST